MIDLAEAYAETRRHLVEIARGLTDDELGTMVPASPAWSVKDVVAHVKGIAGDVSGGALPPELDVIQALTDSTQAEIRDSWTNRQVESRRHLSLEDIVREWEGHLEVLLPMIRNEQPFPGRVPFAGPVVLTDLSVHAQDVRGCLGCPGDRDSAGVSVALVSYATVLRLRLAMNGLPALRLRYDGKERVVGDGEPAATLAGDRFEVTRALSGRRSREQILAMTWEGDPAPYVDLIPAYGPREDAIVE